jgi:hypothetical protein
MLGWDRCESHRKRIGSYYTELVFLYDVQSVDHIVCLGAYGVRNVDTLFFMVRWARCRSQKKHAGTHYIKLVILHHVLFTDHIVRSGVFRT